MFGYLRFLLAILVMLSHIGYRVNGLNPGVFAVILFYLLAGMVVAFLYQKIQQTHPQPLKTFLIERSLRIFPLYLYIALLTLLFILITQFGQPVLTAQNLLQNLTIIPLNFYMYADPSILTQPKWWLIPPAWSLGAELQAYLLLVLLLPRPKILLLAGAGTFIIYTLANLGDLHPDYYGYRLIPGILFIFIIGTQIYQYQQNRVGKRLLLIWLLLFIQAGYLYFNPPLYKAYYIETLAGLLIGIPLIAYLATTSIKLPLNSTLGSLSYGVFLAHFPLIWVLQYFGWTSQPSLFYTVALLTLSVLIAWVGTQYIESHITQKRKNLLKSPVLEPIKIKTTES